MSALSYDDLRNANGRDLGTSRWISVDQNRIDRFADVSGDHQWIHLDTERAARGAFGTTIAHGYLTITLVGTLLGELLRVEPGLVMVNYGLDTLRFLSPVPVGARLSAKARIDTVEETPRGLRVALAVSGEVEDSERPVCVATAVILVQREG